MKYKIFALKRENLQNLGGPMGTESTSIDWIKYFTTVEFAKEYAWKDFSDNRSLAQSIRWKIEKSSKEKLHSEDLGFCMYYIEPIEIIK